MAMEFTFGTVLVIVVAAAVAAAVGYAVYSHFFTKKDGSDALEELRDDAINEGKGWF